MNNEIAKLIAGTSVEKAEQPMSKEVGSAMVKGGAITGGLMLTAGVLPFVSLPFLILLMLVVGGYLYVKN